MTEKTKATAADRKPAKGRKPVIRETAKPAPRKKKIKETVVAKPGVAMLIENELERAEVVLAAKSITGKLQDIAEDLSKIEANDLMPMMDSLRGAFGPQRAEQFSQVATAKIRDLITAVQNSKNGIDTEIGRLETEVNGGDPSDAAMDEPPPPDAGAAPMPGDEGPPAPDGVPPPDAPPAPPEEPPALGAGGFAGRERKESAQRKGKPLTETLAHESPEFTAHLDALAEFSPKCFSAAQDILNRIHDLSASGAIRNKLINALGHVISVAGDAAVWDDPESIASHAARSHLVGGAMDEVAKNPEVGTILRDISKLAHLIGFKHEGHLNEDDMMSSAPPPAPTAAPVPAPMSEARRNKNIQRLRESADPDGLILSVFRKVFRECRNPGRAAQGTANAFAIDVADVVSVVREAKRLAEEGPALMGVAMGAPVAGSPAAPLTTNTMGQAVGTVDTGPGKPRRPMTPAESRAAAQQRDQQDKAAGNNAKQPITAPTTAVPVQNVPPGEAPVTVTPQVAQQRRANSLTAMPGRTVTNATVRA